MDKKYCFGHNVSIANGGLCKNLKSAHSHQCKPNAFQVFVQNAQSFRTSPIKDYIAKECKEYIKESGIYLVVHSPFILNMSKCNPPDPGTFNCAYENIKAAHQIGASGTIFHVGKSLKMDLDEALDNMENFIRKIIKKMKEDNIKSYFILETGAGQGTEVCCDIKDLAKFFKRFSKDEKKHFRFCVDTCHVFASGYNLKKKDDVKEFLKLWKHEIGWRYVDVIHLNDSKKDCACKVDRHENLKEGFIWKDKESNGLKYFIKKMKEKCIPVVLETPDLEGESLTRQLNLIK